ncbi:MAG: hypothetical protein FWC94_04455 [Bacteroidales bacterium]|nr:hypothetical protein [Bacteroidales bacterium]
MKKFILTVCFLSFFSVAAHAEHFAFKIGENRASFGIGFGWMNKGDRFGGGTWNFPSPNALVERSILPFRDFGFLSVGAQFGFHHGHRNHSASGDIPRFREFWTSFYFVPRVALYFHEIFHPDDFPERIDLYVGVGLGFNYLSHGLSSDVTWESLGPTHRDNSGFKFGYHFFVGGRYYFRENMAVFAEIGYGLSFLNVGITLRY